MRKVPKKIFISRSFVKILKVRLLKMVCCAARTASAADGFTLMEVLASVIIISFVVTFLMLRRQELSVQAQSIKYSRQAAELAMTHLAEIEYAAYYEKRSDFDSLMNVDDQFKGFSAKTEDATTETITYTDPLMGGAEDQITLSRLEYVLTTPDGQEFKTVIIYPPTQ